jgi:putative flippase GtrA
MSLHRQGRHYLFFGGIQWLVDWGVMVLLSHLGLAVEAANVCGRISGAILGFWLNGKFTFAGDDTRIGGTQLRRFLLMWLGTTLLSTFAMGRIDDVFGLQWAWLAKPAVELALGVVGFVLSRHWVYKA